MADTPLLSIQNLVKHFPVTKGLVLMKTIGWVKAVDDISFTLQQGETLALVGESGVVKRPLPSSSCVWNSRPLARC